MNLAVILPAAGASRRFHASAGPLADDTRSKLKGRWAVESDPAVRAELALALEYPPEESPKKT